MFEQRKRRTKQKSSVRYIFAKSIEIYGGLWYNKHRLKSLVFCRSPDVADTTFDTTLKVEWVELTEYSPKSDIKPHENAPKRPQLKDSLSSGNKPQAYSHSINYDCPFGQVMSYDTLRVVMSGFAAFKARRAIIS